MGIGALDSTLNLYDRFSSDESKESSSSENNSSNDENKE
jgi:hypothetical protein